MTLENIDQEYGFTCDYWLARNLRLSWLTTTNKEPDYFNDPRVGARDFLRSPRLVDPWIERTQIADNSHHYDDLSVHNGEEDGKSVDDDGENDTGDDVDSDNDDGDANDKVDDNDDDNSNDDDTFDMDEEEEDGD